MSNDAIAVAWERVRDGTEALGDAIRARAPEWQEKQRRARKRLRSRAKTIRHICWIQSYAFSLLSFLPRILIGSPDIGGMVLINFMNSACPPKPHVSLNKHQATIDG